MLGKKLFVFIIALTLAFSVVSSVDPFFLNNTKAFADNGSNDDEDEEKQNSNEDEEDDDSSKDDDEDERDDNSGKDEEDSEDDDNNDEKDDDSDEEKDDDQEDDDSRESEDDDSEKEDHNDDKDEKSEDKLVEQLGENSKASLKIKDETELEVEIEDGDLADGMYDVQFSCEDPEVNKTFDIMVTNGNGESEFELDLAEATYSGCEVNVGGLSASFDEFTVAAREDEDDEEEEDDEDRDREQDMDREQKSKAKLDVEHDGVEIEIEMEGLSLADGLYDVMFSCEDPSVDRTFEDAFEVKDGEGEFETKFDLEEGTYNGCKVTIDETVVAFHPFTVLNKEVRESRHDREQEIVSTNTGREIHERHVQAQPASPGPYEPGLEYTLTVAGTAEDGDTVEDAELNLEAAVWKSNSALVFLDILGGDVTIGDKTYEIVLGYGLFSMNSDTLRARAFAVDDAGDVFVLKLRGQAEMHDEMPEDENELDSLHLMFEGNSGPSKNELNGWELFLDGAIQKSE